MSNNKNGSSLSEKAKKNLSALDLELVTSSAFFRPEPEKTYVISINPEDEVKPVQNPKFANKDGVIPIRYEWTIRHVNRPEHSQTWSTSKTVCTQLKEILENKYTVIEVTRHGSDRNTIYDLKGVQ